MSLKSIDITKVRRLSLREVKLPAQEVRVASPNQVEIPPTEEEIAFNKKASNYPIFKALAETLDLKVMRARKLLDKERSYTKREAIDQIRDRVGGGLINIKKANAIFNKMLDKGTIEETAIKDYYYLKSSTPF